MSESTAQAGSTPATEGGENPSAEGSRTFTQEEVNKLVGEARVKVRGQYADFDKYKEAAERLAEIEEAGKTEMQKANERLAALEQERDALLAEKNASAWRKEVSEATGVPAEVLEGATKEMIEAHAERLKPYFAKESAPVVNVGSPSSDDGDEGDWLRAAINGN
ncbi:hypothetical protein [Eggerthella lenta]|uniref:hypothetical protein n=1 Tax=Eggerthella lenta TaxID=84112 RepID=UPI0022E3CE01|nr:hypothetical protein [Eggerthella lenta]